MVIAGLFGAQHSAKGALLVAGIAAIFTVLGLLVIDPIWVAMMVVIGILTLFSYARDYD
jgi:Flp pilus assembly protein TadB